MTLAALLLVGCSSYRAKTYDFPDPVDTRTRPIVLQEKRSWAPGGVSADNQFAGARLNGFTRIGQDTFQARIEPENRPINPSPYYAFRLWAEADQPITLELRYDSVQHRYWPKLRRAGEKWQPIDSTDFKYGHDSTYAYLELAVGPDTLWVSAQEVQNSGHVRSWLDSLSTHAATRLSTAGTSTLGRPLPVLDIGAGEPKKKELIVLLSRQHPPEVTGYLALKPFVEEILADNPLSRAFRQKFRILVFPLMNPDGVDLGHWRHNAGGIDLNRDWAYYRQPETRQVADFIVSTARAQRSDVILGLDFHSTWYDIYYTNDQSGKGMDLFKELWVNGIQETTGEDARFRSSPLGGPVSKNWFLTQFEAEGITYEIGDDTPRNFIQEKGRHSAREMMKLLILR